MMRIPGTLERFDIWAPGMNDTWDKRLGYPTPVMGQDADGRWYTQAVPEGPAFVVLAKRVIVNGNTVIAMTVTTSQKDSADPLTAARKRVNDALGHGCEKVLAAHRKFWKGFWGASSIQIPDQEALQHYYLTRYYFGSASRPGYPGMGTVEAIWTDDQMFPSFKNDLHNDLESQVQYQAYQTAGNLTEGGVFFEYLWNLLPRFRGYAKSFFGTDGAAVPGVMTYGGHPTTGWTQYCMSPTQAGWIGCSISIGATRRTKSS